MHTQVLKHLPCQVRVVIFSQLINGVQAVDHKMRCDLLLQVKRLQLLTGELFFVILTFQIIDLIDPLVDRGRHFPEFIEHSVVGDTHLEISAAELLQRMRQHVNRVKNPAVQGDVYKRQGWMMPNQFLTHVWEGNDPDLWDKMRDFNNNAKVSKASGFSFDSTNVANEITAVQNVYNEYQTSVEYGFVDPETGIAEMNDKMMAAGLQKIIDEKAAQLAAWQEANKK